MCGVFICAIRKKYRRDYRIQTGFASRHGMRVGGYKVPYREENEENQGF